MVKGDDVVKRKKNKANRKKLNKQQNDSSKVAARIASIIAAKKRRKSGKRRMCQGMCFSLPTPDDPFNDKQGKIDFKKKEKRKVVKGKTTVPNKESFGKRNTEDNHLEQTDEMSKLSRGATRTSLSGNTGQEGRTDLERSKIQLVGEVGAHGHQKPDQEILEYPSKFLMMCLNEIENALHKSGILDSEKEKPFFFNTWGVEFWKQYSVGNDILDTSGSSPNMEQIAWLASIAADAIARKEKDGVVFNSPFLLFLVSSQDKAAKVRSVCKPLKALGIHTVNLHPGASLDHQINGLKSCEPEFLISTPERLLELVSLKAIDASGLSLLVVDQLQSLYRDGCLDALKSIKQAISGRPQTVVFSDGFNHRCISAVQILLNESICRLSLNDSVASQGACIIQSVNVCASNEERLVKCVEVLDKAYGENLQLLKVLCIVKKNGKFKKLGPALKLKGYCLSTQEYDLTSEVKRSLDSDDRVRPVVSMINTDQISSTSLEEYDIIILPEFVPAIQNYVQILTRMARCTVKGALHSFLTEDDALQAGPLVEILEKCGQAVPEALRKLCCTQPVFES